MTEKLILSRKKKCDATGFPCENCTRLGLPCENTTVLVWEDDVRRAGMKRRGPPVLKKKSSCVMENPIHSSPQEGNLHHEDVESSLHQSELLHDTELDDNGSRIEDVRLPAANRDQISQNRQLSPSQVVRYHHLTEYPHTLSTVESLLLDNYIQRFSRMYPTYSGPRNPFLSILLPLAMRNDVVFNSLLALSGVQLWDRCDPRMEVETLRLRQRALRGCRFLLEDCGAGKVSSVENDIVLGNDALLSHAQRMTLGDIEQMDEEKALVLLTSSTLFLLYANVSGEPNWKPHFEFMNRLFSHFFKRFIDDSISDSAAVSATSETVEALRFLHNTFLYNDLVRSTSLRTCTLSKFYLRAALPGSLVVTRKTHFTPGSIRLDHGLINNSQSRYYFPNLIARISYGDHMVSDADIMAWNGNMDWLPSFSLMNTGNGSTSYLRADVLHPEPPGGETFSHNMDRNHTNIESWDEQTIITELYSTAARIYRRQVSRHHEHSNAVSRAEVPVDEIESSETIASWAIQVIQLLPEGSAYENTLLWPIGIAARELSKDHTTLREYVISRLRSMEQRFQMRYFKRVQNILTSYWRNLDNGVVSETYQSVMGSEIILLG
jgi:hypothetical protein